MQTERRCNEGVYRIKVCSFLQPVHGLLYVKPPAVFVDELLLKQTADQTNLQKINAQTEFLCCLMSMIV
jgi:hypothetical protein